MARRDKEREGAAPEIELPLEQRVLGNMAQTLREAGHLAETFRSAVDKELEKLSDTISILGEQNITHRVLNERLEMVKLVAEDLGISLPEDPGEIEESNIFIQGWAGLKQEIADSAAEIERIRDILVRKQGLEIISDILSYQEKGLARFQKQWSPGFTELKQAPELVKVSVDADEPIEIQRGKTRQGVINVLQEGPTIKTILVHRLLGIGFNREVVIKTLDELFEGDDVVEAGWSTTTGLLRGKEKKTGTGYIWKLKTQVLPEGSNFFPRLTPRQVRNRFGENLVEELARTGPLTAEQIIEWHYQFEGAKLNDGWYPQRISRLVNRGEIRRIIKGRPKRQVLYEAILNEGGQEEKS